MLRIKQGRLRFRDVRVRRSGARPVNTAQVLEERCLLSGAPLVAYGESMSVVHAFGDGHEHDEHEHDEGEHDHNVPNGAGSHFLARTGTASYFAWQDQIPETADVVDLYYDYRPIGTFTNFITPEQIVAAETAMAGWIAAADGGISFTRNTSAPLTDIINIGVGDLAALGYTSQPEGILALGGGTVTHGDQPTITEGIAWLDFSENWDSTFGNEDPPGTFDSFTVLAHEIGHALGLGHTNDLPGADIMDGGYVGEKTTFSTNDQTLIQVLYGDAQDIEPPDDTGSEVTDSDTVLAPDQVYNDDLIVNGGSECIGNDCVNGENFGFDTLRLKENNIRVHFDDTSRTGSFPDNDWRIRINDSTNGGDSYFAIEDSSGGRTPFRIDAGAPNHSLYIEDGGRVGFGTSTPVVELHVASGDSPTLRLEQNGTSGWTPQTWDVAGNEANFFIRDVTNGSTLPFRIRPAAPSNSLYIDTGGDVGVGTSSPSSSLHVRRSNGTAQILADHAGGGTATRSLVNLTNNGPPELTLLNSNDGAQWTVGYNVASSFEIEHAGGTSLAMAQNGRTVIEAAGIDTFDLLDNGNLTIAGTLTAPSSRALKENFQDVQVLSRVVDLPLFEWNYTDDPDDVRHFGPLAEDFYAAFGLGRDAQHIAPSDLAGVSIAAAQELLEIVEYQDLQIDVLAALAGIPLPQSAAVATSEWLAGFAGTYFADVGASIASQAAVTDALETVLQQSLPSGTAVGVAADGTAVYAVIPAVEAVSTSGAVLAEGHILVEAPVEPVPEPVLSMGVPASEFVGPLTVADAQLAATRVLAADQVISDDIIVRGSACIGMDCNNGESFGSDTLRLKENNLRITFIDTSTSASFPKGDWQIRANDSSNGGGNFLAIDDLGDNASGGGAVVRTPFRVEGGAPNHSFYVDAQGDVGFGTNAPVTELHVKDGDSPTLRLEQNGTSGWTPQTWDLAGNETNFFVRDVSNGSTLPFRIRPSAPQNSLFIEDTGDIGIGTASPTGGVHVRRSNGTANVLVQEVSGTTAERSLLTLSNVGDPQLTFTNTDNSVVWTTGLGSGNGNNAFEIAGPNSTSLAIAEGGGVQIKNSVGTTTFDLLSNGDLTIAGMLTQGSSRSIKENFVAADVAGILTQVAGLPVQEWNYIDSPDSRHIGPFAEDFFAAFGLGEDAQHIAVGDLAGIAVAAVQGLSQRIQVQSAQLDALADAFGVSVALPAAADTPALPDQASGSPTVARTFSAVLAALADHSHDTSGSVTSSTGRTGSQLDAADPSTIAADVVFNDDLIAKFSQCVGFDCVNGESFGFDTLRLKENNLRLHFQDTSVTASFPTNDWRLLANDTTNGGGEYFGIEDANTNRIPFRTTAGAPSNSVFVDDSGDVGFGTSTPVTDLHVASGDSPTLRLEQDGTSGWTPQAWDIAGNETNFFIRDATNGSPLPFRIEPGAPSSAIDIEGTTGDVGVGTSSPTAPLHIRRTGASAADLLVEEVNGTATTRSLLNLTNNGAPLITFTDTDDSVTWTLGYNVASSFEIEHTNGTSIAMAQNGRTVIEALGTDIFDLMTNGNLVITGNFMGSSSHALKENLGIADPGQILSQLVDLPLQQWNYISDAVDTAHFGPFAQDFHAMFGWGADAEHLAPADLASTALAGVQGLFNIVEHHDSLLDAVFAAAGHDYDSPLDDLPTGESASVSTATTSSESTPVAADAGGPVRQTPAGLVLLADEHVPGPGVNIDPTSVLQTDEGGEAVVKLDITDAVDSAFDVMIDWGDGGPVTTTRIEGNGRTLDQPVEFAHLYEDDNPTLTSSDVYTVVIDVTNVTTLGTTQVITLIGVTNVDPTLSNLVATALDGSQNATISGTVIDPAGDSEVLTLTINWDDGTPDTVVPITEVDRTFDVSHQFVGSGPFDVIVTVDDDDLGSSSSTVSVSDDPTALTNVSLELNEVDEGQEVDLNVTIVGSGPFTLEIDWEGDGTFDNTFPGIAAGPFEFPHTYLDDEPIATASDMYDVVVRLTNTGNGIVNEVILPITVNNVAPSIRELTATPLVGGDATIDLLFEDPAGADGLLAPDDTFDITINWGDGTPDTVLMDQTIGGVQQPGFFVARPFSQMHTFVGSGPFTVTVTIEDDDLGSTSGMVTVAAEGLVDVAVNGGTSAVINEGDTVTLTGFVNGNATTLTVDWDGDSNPDDTFTVQPDQPFSFTHTYPDDDPTGTPSDQYTVGVDLSGGITDSTTVDVTVNNVAPDIRNLNATPQDVGGNTTLSGEFDDPGVNDTFDIMIVDWGDGTSDTLPTQPETTFNIAHQYADPSQEYTVSVQVMDDDGGIDSDTVDVAAFGAEELLSNVLIDGAERTTVDEGDTVTLTGTVSSAGTLDIDWDGDGTFDESLALPVGDFSVPHLYEDDDTPGGLAQYNVDIMFTNGSTESATRQANVLNVAPEIVELSLNGDSGPEVTAPEGTVSLDVMFSDPGVLDSHTATIDWGDGSMSTIPLPVGNRMVSTTHDYNTDVDATFTVSVTLDDDNGGSDSQSALLEIVNTAPSITDIAVDFDVINEGQSVTASGTFVAPTGLPGNSVGLDPTQFASLGVFDPTSNVVIDTASLSMTGGHTATGVSTTVTGPDGPVDIAVFTFDSIELDAGLMITATGSRPLALLSLADISVAGTIDVSASGVTPGAGGGSGGTTSSGQPAAGAPLTSVGQLLSNSGGGGGAFGGNGGQGSDDGVLAAEQGLSFGDLAAVIQGGSGGAAGLVFSPAILFADGGAGGGGLELGAIGLVEVVGSGSLLANGADGAANGTDVTGGGGAGGGLLLHGFDVSIAGTLSADGGDSPASTPGNDGGAGGGGRILIAHDAAGSFTNSGTQTVQGGTAVVPASPEVSQDGGDGTIDTVQTFDPSAFSTFSGSALWSDGVTTPVILGSGTFQTTRQFDSTSSTGTVMDPFTVDVTILNGVNEGDTATSPVVIVNRQIDFGDAPLPYQTTQAEDGARHTAAGPMLGATRDHEPDGVHSAAADADGGDEDGVTFPAASSIQPGSAFDLLVDSTPGELDFFFDWDGNGVFGNTAGEVYSTTLAGGLGQIVPVAVPAGANIGEIFARFRISSAGGLGPNGFAPDGEVEDYRLDVTSPVTVMPDPQTPGLNIMKVTGTPDDDVIQPILVGGGTQIRVWVNGRLYAPAPVATLSRIDVMALAGNDTVVVQSSITLPTTISGGDDNDFIVGGSGPDTIDGDGGDDDIYSGAGADTVNGGDGQDDVFGGDDNDMLFGNANDDRLFGGGGDDGLDGGAGADSLRGQAGNDTLDGGPDNDYVDGGADNDNATGGSGNDLVLGRQGDDILDGGDDDDVVVGESGDDILRGGAGNDDIYGGDDDDVVLGDDGNDSAFGGAGRDIVIGGAGVDDLHGDDDDDVLVTGSTTKDGDNAALQGLLAQWTSADPYPVRVINLKLPGVLNPITGDVIQDTDIDIAFGGLDLDWFVFDPALDVLPDLDPINEIQN